MLLLCVPTCSPSVLGTTGQDLLPSLPVPGNAALLPRHIQGAEVWVLQIALRGRGGQLGHVLPPLRANALCFCSAALNCCLT